MNVQGMRPILPRPVIRFGIAASPVTAAIAAKLKGLGLERVTEVDYQDDEHTIYVSQVEMLRTVRRELADSDRCSFGLVEDTVDMNIAGAIYPVHVVYGTKSRNRWA